MFLYNWAMKCKKPLAERERRRKERELMKQLNIPADRPSEKELRKQMNIPDDWVYGGSTGPILVVTGQKTDQASINHAVDSLIAQRKALKSRK